MPIFICYNHFLNNLLDVFVCSFNSPIHLRSVGRRIMMCNLEVFTKGFNHIFVQVQSFISNDLTWHTITTYNLILDKPHNNLLGYICIRCRFNPLCEIINSHQMKRCSFEALGSIIPIISIPHMEKGHGEEITFKSVGGT